MRYVGKWITNLPNGEISDKRSAIDGMPVLIQNRFNVLGAPVACVDMPVAIQTVRGWLQDQSRGRTVTFTNIHMIMEGVKSESFRELIASMDMNCPDGMPLVWAGRRKGIQGIARVCGPESLPWWPRRCPR